MRSLAATTSTAVPFSSPQAFTASVTAVVSASPDEPIMTVSPAESSEAPPPGLEHAASETVRPVARRAAPQRAARWVDVIA
ncbi:hypothetical protein Q0F99_09445 [Rathayibacter oskolensis]|uniref:hypothetical protein n=1 Tax=Rathayibacter oskolensis TaxID=1891671 RepID=UPI00265DCAC8|nr:hypothetical protein [Rathayibacter oskolensis]WKK73046.1 hypothetical protein Q0F99_09445 [Rathayibacter oskolensis]